MQKFNILICVVAMFALLSCQKDSEGGQARKGQGKKVLTEGVITYALDFPDDMGGAGKAMLPKKAKYAFKDGKAAASFSMALGMVRMKFISDRVNNKTYMLNSAMGIKTGVDITSADIDVYQDSIDLSIETTEETKEIAGYTCKKLVLRDNKSGEETAAYITEEINPGDIYGMLPIDLPQGTLMEFVFEGAQSFGVKAIEVEKKSISDSMFEVPSDYKMMNMEEYQNQNGSDNPM